MRLVVFGSRRGFPEHVVRAYIRSLPSDYVIITGGAPGVDSVAHDEAEKLGMQTEVYPADWDQYGKAAGPKRNAVMAEKADAGAGFRVDGPSPGTDDMKRQLVSRGKPVRIRDAQSRIISEFLPKRRTAVGTSTTK